VEVSGVIIDELEELTKESYETNTVLVELVSEPGGNQQEAHLDKLQESLVHLNRNLILLI
jgi:hypothetical protein